MINPKLQALGPVLYHLLKLMKKEQPDALPFDDNQDWKLPVSDVPSPGTWGLVVGADTQNRDTAVFKQLPQNPSVSAMVIHLPGPPRAFLIGWNPKENRSVSVSMPLFHE